ncbi:MAG: hypothetical protein ACYCTG_00870 [Ferrimicrobium sp.]
MIDYSGPALYRHACDTTSDWGPWWELSRILLITGDHPDEVANLAVREGARALEQFNVRLPSLIVISEATMPYTLPSATGYVFVQIGLCPTHPDILRGYTRLLGAALDSAQPVVLASILADNSYPQRFGIPLIRRLNPHVRVRSTTMTPNYPEELPCQA